MSNNKITITEQPEITLSKEQKQFNRLNKQIANEKKLLLDWQNHISEFKILYAKEMAPLENKFKELKIQTVYLLDKSFENSIFSKTDRKKMLYIIEEIAQLVAEDDEKVKAIYNKRSGNDFDDEQKIRQDTTIDLIKSSFADQFNIDMENFDIDPNNPEEFIQKFAQHMQDKVEQDQAKKSKRKKSAKTLEKEAKIEQENQEISQSIKEVYRQLAKTLHPDREIDPNEKARKTELMQKINTAYNKQDLITLLQVQLEIEQIDQNSINSINIDKVKHYNIILKNQLQEVKQEIFFICERFNREFEVPMFTSFSPKSIVLQLRRDIYCLAQDIERITNELNLWEDHVQLKNQLKEINIPKYQDQFNSFAKFA